MIISPRLLSVSLLSLNSRLITGFIPPISLSSSSSSRLFSTQVGFPLISKPHKGCEIDISSPSENLDKASLTSSIKSTIAEARSTSRSSIWVALPSSSPLTANLLPTLLSHNFKYHHTTPDTLHMYLWLDDKFPDRVPDYATTQIGVGALVLNAKNELLVVREMSNNFSKYKLPGGLADVGEHLGEAAVREVQEETGVATKFESVLAFRHSHGIQFGRGDIYFVCKLSPVSEDQIPVPQPGEIESCQWLPFDKYLATIAVDGETPHPFMRHVMRTYKEGREITPFYYDSVVPGRAPSPIYSCLDPAKEDNTDLK